LVAPRLLQEVGDRLQRVTGNRSRTQNPLTTSAHKRRLGGTRSVEVVILIIVVAIIVMV
jgi:hypothetical protein